MRIPQEEDRQHDGNILQIIIPAIKGQHGFWDLLQKLKTRE